MAQTGQIMLLLYISVAFFNSLNAQTVDSGSPTAAGPDITTETPDQGEGTCENPGTAKASPITINTYGCGTGAPGTPGANPSSQTLDNLEDKMERLVGRVSQLETYVNTLLQGGGGSNGGGDGGGGGICPPIFGQKRFKDCLDIRTNGTTTTGTYQIYPQGAQRPYNVLCVFNAAETLTVVQQRRDNTVPFQRNWNEYQQGFGDLVENGNFWVGLDAIHLLTAQRQYRLRVDLEDFQSQTRRAEYKSFYVGPLSDRYRLKVFMYDEDVSPRLDAFTNYHNGLPFSTFDMDNDYAIQNCAFEHSGGWWYRDCDNANLNGKYIDSPGTLDQPENGIEWDAWKRMTSMKSVRMSLIPFFRPNVNFGPDITNPTPAPPP